MFGFRAVQLRCVGCLAVVALCCSCVTHALWRDTNPHEVLWIPADQITVAELERRGVAYSACSDDRGEGFVVGKSSEEKFQDYTLRTLGTPVTIVIDAATVTLVVVGWLVLESALDSGEDYGGD